MALLVSSLSVVNVGSHAGNHFAMQEYMNLSIGAAPVREAMKMGTETYQYFKNLTKMKYDLDATGLGDEGGFALNIPDNFKRLKLLEKATPMAGYTGKFKLGMNVATSEFWRDDL